MPKKARIDLIIKELQGELRFINCKIDKSLQNASKDLHQHMTEALDKAYAKGLARALEIVQHHGIPPTM